MQKEPIYLEKRGEIGVMVLNRPSKLNALNTDVWTGIKRITDQVADDTNIKVMVVKGVTSAAFSAGADISEFSKIHATEESMKASEAITRAAFDGVADLVKPIIAMVSGYCFGGGCALALACDVRYADRSAKFRIPPARLGVAYTLRETKRLVDLVGPSKAKEMLMGAKVIEAEEALACGLATRLFDASELEAETFDFADSLCGLSQFTIRAVKTIIAEISAGATDENAVSRKLRADAFAGPDYKEGRAAFLEKRQPRFEYR